VFVDLNAVLGMQFNESVCLNGIEQLGEYLFVIEFGMSMSEEGGGGDSDGMGGG
jgi:hypothetical protein